MHGNNKEENTHLKNIFGIYMNIIWKLNQIVKNLNNNPKKAVCVFFKLNYWIKSEEYEKYKIQWCNFLPIFDNAFSKYNSKTYILSDQVTILKLKKFRN